MDQRRTPMTTRPPFMTLVRSSAVAVVALLALAGCDRQQVVAPDETISEQRAHAGPASVSNAHVVEVIARHDGPDCVFDLSDDVIPPPVSSPAAVTGDRKPSSAKCRPCKPIALGT